MIQVRVDDFPGTKPAEFYRHNLENFQRFHEVMLRHMPSYVLGVIPRHATQEQLDWLWKQEEIVFALHGVEHDELRDDEFPDYLTEKDIFDRLVAARLWISGPKVVNRYIPPHNAISKRTVDALDRAGFLEIYGGPGSSHENMNYARSKHLRAHYSSAPHWYGRSDELLSRGSAHELTKPGALGVLTLHWTWETNIGLEHLNRYLERLAPALR